MKKTIGEIQEIEEEKLLNDEGMVEQEEIWIPPVEEQAPENPYYTLGSWQGMMQWKCRFCPWDTLEGEERLMEHIITVHGPGEPIKPAGSILRADRFGNEISE